MYKYCCGIITFHRASNYGAVLQAYALQSAFRTVGIPSKIIDYRTPMVELDHMPWLSIKKYGILRGIRYLPGKIRKYFIFNRFRRRRLDVTQKVGPSEITEIGKQYKALVVGSDQVWNPTFAGHDLNLFLAFACTSKRFGYACSFGTVDPDARTVDICRELLPVFKGISLREESGKRFVEREIGLRSRVDLDPVLLLDREAWKDFCNPPRESGYILIYSVAQPIRLVEFAKELGRRIGKEVVYLNNAHASFREVRHVRYVNPERFVGWFANAGIVLTNSFHGTAFSLVFQRQFMLEQMSKKGINNRSIELLELCGLQDRVLRPTVAESMSALRQPIDWGCCQAVLDRAKVSSLKYLTSICDNIIEDSA